MPNLPKKKGKKTMTKKCMISEKGVLAGNNNSYSKRKTRRRFMPNLQTVAIYSEVLGTTVDVRITSNGLRTIEKNGGLDLYLLNTPVSKLSADSKKLRERIAAAKAKKAE